MFQKERALKKTLSIFSSNNFILSAKDHIMMNKVLWPNTQCAFTDTILTLRNTPSLLKCPPKSLWFLAHSKIPHVLYSCIKVPNTTNKLSTCFIHICHWSLSCSQNLESWKKIFNSTLSEWYFTAINVICILLHAVYGKTWVDKSTLINHSFFGKFHTPGAFNRVLPYTVWLKWIHPSCCIHLRPLLIVKISKADGKRKTSPKVSESKRETHQRSLEVWGPI